MINREGLKHLFTSYWQFLAIRAACQLNLFDFIHKNGITTSEHIIEELNISEQPLMYLLNNLAYIGLVSRENEGYSITQSGILLTDNSEHSLKHAAIFWGDDHLDSWQNLIFTLQTGKSYFQERHQLDYFSYLSTNPQKLYDYQHGINAYAIDDYHDIHSRIDLTGITKILDVGGGLGFLVNLLKIHYPEKEFYLLERKEVLNLINEPVSFCKLEGDFFNTIPAIAEAILLARVLHDWPNEQVKQILNNAYKALPTKGKLIILENLPERMVDSASLLQLNMLLMCSSYERSLEEYSILAESVGFVRLSFSSINSYQYQLIFGKQ